MNVLETNEYSMQYMFRKQGLFIGFFRTAYEYILSFRKTEIVQETNQQALSLSSFKNIWMTAFQILWILERDQEAPVTLRSGSCQGHGGSSCLGRARPI
jgi:hypothetical protein